MNCIYTTNYEDFKQAQRLHMSVTPRLKITFWIFLRIFPAVGLLAFVLLASGLLPLKNSIVVAIASGLIAGGAWGLVMALLRPFSLRRLYKQMKNGRPDNAEIGLEIADGQLISRVPGISEGRFLPAAIQQFVENDKIALLYVQKRRFLLIPKNALDEANWVELRNWLGSNTRIQSS